MNKNNNFDFSCRTCSMKFHSEYDLMQHVTKCNHVKLDKLEMEVKIVLKKLHLYDCDKCCEKFCRSQDLHTHAKVHKKHHILTTSSKDNVMKGIKCEFCGTKFNQRSNLVEDTICQCKINEIGDNNKRKPNLEPEYNNGHNQEAEIQTRIKLDCKEPDLESKRNFSAKINNKKKSAKNIHTKLYPPSMKQEDLSCSTRNARNRTKVEQHVDDDSDDHFTCGQCPKSFKTFARMSTHLIDHSGPPFLCMKCPKTFQTFSARNKHVKQTHLAKYDVECTTCLKKFKTHNNLIIHLRVHTGERPYPCKQCGKRFTQSAALYTHTKIHLGLKEHVCSYCHKAFTEYHNMKNHERTHTKERPFVCQYCKRAFSDPSALKRHVRTHTGDKIYPCEQCHMKFTDASGLIAHRRRHAGIKKFTCEFCSKNFYTRSELLKHESAVHMNLKRFECDLCAKKFSLKQYLKWHIERNHMRSISCSICTMKFFSNVELEKHRSLGCVKDKFECDICGIKLPLKIHLKNHMEQKHFQAVYCHICMGTFYTDYHLQKHKAKANCVKKLYVEDKIRDKENEERNVS